MLAPPLGPEGGDYKPLKLLLVSNMWRSGQVCGRGRYVGVVGTYMYLGIETMDLIYMYMIGLILCLYSKGAKCLKVIV